ncbi:MAG: T9SS type A sorting domain-containing protein [Bacteroidetes bacterium]|nr:T9SS type A sorting domain-containing protein [Bacteroidota bacterium]
MPDFKLGALTPCWPNAVGEVELQAPYKIYPNPVAKHLQIEWNLNGDSSGVVQLVDLTGNILLDIAFNPGYQIKSIDLSALNSGIYILRFISNRQSIGYEKIIKR